MHKRFLTALVVVALSTSSGFAKGKPSGERGHDAKQHHEHDRDDHQGHDRDSHHEHDKQAKARPAGWDKGKKTGWGNCDVPPGQAKKSGCDSRVSHHDRDHHDRDRHVTTAHHEHTVRTQPAPRPYPVRHTATTTRTTTTTTTSTTAPKGEHPFSPTLRKKKEVESKEPMNSGEKTK